MCHLPVGGLVVFVPPLRLGMSGAGGQGEMKSLYFVVVIQLHHLFDYKIPALRKSSIIEIKERKTFYEFHFLPMTTVLVHLRCNRNSPLISCTHHRRAAGRSLFSCEDSG